MRKISYPLLVLILHIHFRVLYLISRDNKSSKIIDMLPIGKTLSKSQQTLKNITRKLQARFHEFPMKDMSHHLNIHRYIKRKMNSAEKRVKSVT